MEQHVLKRLLQRIRRVRPELYRSGQLTTPVRTLQSACSTFSLDAGPLFFHTLLIPQIWRRQTFLFTRLKLALKGFRFADVAVIKCDHDLARNSTRCVC